MGKPSDRNINYMYNEWGTKELITDYNNIMDRKVLSEVEFNESEYDDKENSCNCNCKKTTILNE
jgi:hypothetical protein